MYLGSAWVTFAHSIAFRTTWDSLKKNEIPNTAVRILPECQISKAALYGFDINSAEIEGKWRAYTERKWRAEIEGKWRVEIEGKWRAEIEWKWRAEIKGSRSLREGNRSSGSCLREGRKAIEAAARNRIEQWIDKKTAYELPVRRFKT